MGGDLVNKIASLLFSCLIIVVFVFSIIKVNACKTIIGKEVDCLTIFAEICIIR